MKILSIHIMHHFYHQRILQMYLLDQNIISAKQRVCCNKNIIFDLLLNKSKSFYWQASLIFIILKDKTFSSNIDQIS